MSDLRSRLDRAFDFAAGQVRGMIDRDPDAFPSYTRSGRWNHGGEVWTDWCAGFPGGMLRRIAERTGSADWRAAAEHYARLAEPKKHDRSIHNLGFIFLPTYLPWYRATGDPAINDVLVTAGRSLAMRYNAKGRYLRSFLAPESLLIDIMMNVPLVFHAAIETGDEALYALAEAHCRTTERALVRPDGSTAQEAIFDLETGELLRVASEQGIAPGSTWSRGLAWCLSGFTSVYMITGDPQDLAVAERNAECWLDRCPDGVVPPWDLDLPDEPGRLVDSSAASIAATGLLALAELVDDPGRSARYRASALALLDTLVTDRYMAWSTPGWEGILLHGVYHHRKGLGVDESLIWGDYYLLEAIDRALRVIP